MPSFALTSVRHWVVNSCPTGGELLQGEDKTESKPVSGTMDFGGAFCNWSNCVPCVLCYINIFFGFE